MHRLLSLLLALVLALPAVGQEHAGAFPDTPALVVSISPQETVDRGGDVNGQIVVHVRVLSRFPFETLDLRLPKIENAQQVRLLSPRTRYVESYGGSGYVHETAIAVFPVHSEPLTIRAITLRGSVATPEGKQSFSDAFPEQQILIHGINQAFLDTWWLVSEDVKISEHWSIPPEDIRYGDIVRREISMAVSGVTADHVPILEHPQTRGIEVSQDGRTVATKLTAASTVAHVTQAWRIKIGADGFADIPPLGLAFWHPKERRKRNAFVPGRRLEPLPADTGATAARLMAEAFASHRTDRTLFRLVVAILLIPVVAIGGVAFWVAFPSWADLHLKRIVSQKSLSDLDRIQAIESWARISRVTHHSDQSGGFSLPQSFTDLREAVFGRGSVRGDIRHLSRDLLCLSRHVRWQRVLGRLSQI